MRIVSLLSSATEMVYALGLEDQLVGISHECDYPPAALQLPRVSRTRFDPRGLSSGEIDAEVRRCMQEFGSVYEVDVQRLRALEPDLVLTQAVCEVCAVPTGSVEDAVRQLSRPPRVLSLDAHTLSEIIDSARAIAHAAGSAARGEELAARLQQRVDRVAERVARAPRPRVLLLEWLDPPFAPGHWVPEMVGLAGGANLLGEAGARSKQVAPEEVQGLRPDRLLIEPCGYDLAQARDDAERHRRWLHSVGGGAAERGDAWLLHSSYFSRSGPRVVEGVEVLARLIHPDLFPDVPLEGRAERWK